MLDLGQKSPRAIFSGKSRASDQEQSHRMQLMLSVEAAENLEYLKKDNECASYGEVIRRAVHLLERVIEKVGVPSIEPVEGLDQKLSRGVQVLLSTATLGRIEAICASQEELSSKSDTIRMALELYGQVSSAQRDMESFYVKGPRGKMQANLALMP